MMQLCEEFSRDVYVSLQKPECTGLYLQHQAMIVMRLRKVYSLFCTLYIGKLKYLFKIS